MHIEKNVCDNVFGTVLGLDGKTKDDAKSRATLEKLGLRSKLWAKKGRSGKVTLPQADYTVRPTDQREVFAHIAAVRYPRGYAGSLKNKVKVSDKKFYGLKTHDCHVMLQRVLPVVIRSYLGSHVADALVELSRFFQMICSRELKKSDVRQMQTDIVIILCKLETIFPPAFFTIMVHLCIHLPEQVLRTGPVHYTWMFSTERQLGEFKKDVGNKRYPEGCIAERNIMHECVTYINNYLDDPNASDEVIADAPRWNISVVTDLVKPSGCVRTAGLSRAQIATAHWCVMENCPEAEWYIDTHRDQFASVAPDGTDDQRIESFLDHFPKWMYELQIRGAPKYNREVQILASLPMRCTIYSRCEVNGVKFVCQQRDQIRKTQNSGVTVVAGDVTYYGILQAVVELRYAEGMPVVLFMCKWYNTDPDVPGSTKYDRGLLSVNTNTSWYDDFPFILAKTASQVFYIDDPSAGEGWKVVNVMSHRGTYSETTLARDATAAPLYEVEEPYQEPDAICIPISTLFIDFSSVPQIDIPDDDDSDEDDDYDEDDDSDDAEGFNNDLLSADEDEDEDEDQDDDDDSD